MRDKTLDKWYLRLIELCNKTIKNNTNILSIITDLLTINYCSIKLEQWNKWYELLLNIFQINEFYIEDIFNEFKNLSINFIDIDDDSIIPFIQKYNLKLITETWLLSFEENLIIE